MQKRIIVSTLLSIAVILISLGIISHYSIENSIRHALKERLELAKTIANYTDTLLQESLTRLYDISLSGAVDLEDGNWEPESKALLTAYQYSIFSDGVFLMDVRGNIKASHPPGREEENLLSIPYIRRALEENRSVISDVYTVHPSGKKVIFALVPLKDINGNFSGLAGGEINPTNYILNQIMKSIPSNEVTFMELVDGRGTVIASNNPSRIFTCSDHDRFLENLIAAKKTSVTTCHRCHPDALEPQGDIEFQPHEKTVDMLAFAPLSETSWGVSVREPKDIVYAPSTDLKKKFTLLAMILMGSALVLAIGMSKSIVKPIRSLISATESIARGNLAEPVKVPSKNEVGLLSESFEAMRVNLYESHERIKSYNIELERRVMERTKELMRNRKRLENLLMKLLTAQEEERKRIARELHDETSQSLVALGMSIDIADMALRENRLMSHNMEELKRKVNQVLDGIHFLIRDLRPPVLDDLGLESAARWLLTKHLATKGINCHLTATDRFKTAFSDYNRPAYLRGNAELMLFRIIQEAVINIQKHSKASNVFVYLDCRDSTVEIDIEDDGTGFDVHSALNPEDGSEGRSFGLLGMKERISILDGRLTICSQPGMGTYINITVPINLLEA